MPPALQVGFLTTGPSGESCLGFFFFLNFCFHCSEIHINYFNCFKLYSPVTFSTFTVLCNHHNIYLVPEHFHHAQRATLYLTCLQSLLISPSLFPPPSPPQSVICFLFLQVTFSFVTSAFTCCDYITYMICVCDTHHVSPTPASRRMGAA